MGDYGAWMATQYTNCQEAFQAERKKTIELTAALREIRQVANQAEYQPGSLRYLVSAIERLTKEALGDN